TAPEPPTPAPLPPPTPRPAATATAIVVPVETSAPADVPPIAVAVNIPPPAPAPSAVLVPPPPANPKPAHAGGAGQFAVQLAVYQKISGIAGGWRKYQSGFAEIIGKLEPRVAIVDLGDGRGPLYRLKAGPFGSAAAAETVCRRLKAAGAECKVSDFDGAPAAEFWKEQPIE
ncbi:MAG: SPOR domain-containing protein, partial [Aliidongia sp.]